MKTWSEALRDGLITGSIASILSTVALSRQGRRENGSAYTPTNAISHWVWGERAKYEDQPSCRHTLLGYCIHHGSATLWAVMYEKWFGACVRRGELGTAAAGAAAVSTLACFVDLQMTPQRLRPGFETRLSGSSLFLVYASFGAGLLAYSAVRRG